MHMYVLIFGFAISEKSQNSLIVKPVQVDIDSHIVDEVVLSHISIKK